MKVFFATLISDNLSVSNKAFYNKRKALDFDPVFARRVCEAYFKKYEKKALDNGDFETLARCHNGGCGWGKNKSATDKYWQKIKKTL